MKQSAFVVGLFALVVFGSIGCDGTNPLSFVGPTAVHAPSSENAGVETTASTESVVHMVRNVPPATVTVTVKGRQITIPVDNRPGQTLETKNVLAGVRASSSGIPSHCMVESLLFVVQQTDRSGNNWGYKVAQLRNSDGDNVLRDYRCTSNRGANYGATWGITDPGYIGYVTLFTAFSSALTKGCYAVYAVNDHYAAARGFCVTVY